MKLSTDGKPDPRMMPSARVHVAVELSAAAVRAGAIELEKVLVAGWQSLTPPGATARELPVAQMDVVTEEHGFGAKGSANTPDAQIRLLAVRSRAPQPTPTPATVEATESSMVCVVLLA